MKLIRYAAGFAQSTFWLKPIVGLLAVMFLSACSATQPVTRGSDPAFTPTAAPLPVPSEYNNGAIFQVAHGRGLFDDNKARQIGDIINVRLVERTQARKSANTDTSKDSSLEMNVGSLFGRDNAERALFIQGRNPLTLLNNNLEGSRSFSGSGNTAQSNQLDGTIAVVVSDVLPNGNLVVQGEKWLTLNQGEEYIRLSGIIRPVDVRPDNTILSTQIANAQVQYGGRGTLADSNRPGLITRFFNSPIWPF